MTLRPKQVSVVGWYGQRNAGDEAFRLVFEQAFAGHHLAFTQVPLNSNDLIVYGGGGVTVDRYLDNLMRPAYALGVDIPVNGPKWDRLMKLPFKKVWVRSKEYALIAKSQGMDAAYIPDLVFYLDRPKVCRLPFKRVVGVNVTHELAEHHYKDMAAALDQIAETAQIVFIPMYHGTTSSDVEAQNRVIGFMKRWDRVENGNFGFDPQAVLNRIAACDFLISMRFHGVIFATVAGVPFLSLAQPGKHSLFCEQERLKPQHVNLRELTVYRILDQYEAISADRGLKSKLLGIAKANRKLVRATLQDFVETYTVTD